MAEEEMTSSEKLENLLREGRISPQEYEQLKRAMRAGEPQAESIAPEAPRRGRLKKTWADQRIAGVCGGIAAYFGIDPVLVRIGAVVLLFLISPATIIAYALLAFVLPWDDPEAAATSKPRFSFPPWAFGIMLLLMDLVLFVFYRLVFERFREFWDSADARLPFLTQIAVTFNHLAYGGADAMILQVLVIAFLITAYSMCRRALRGLLAASVGALFVLWMGLTLASLYLPLFKVGDIIK